MVLKLGSASDKRRAREASARRVRKRLGSPGVERASKATIRKVTTSKSRGGGSRTTTEVIGEAQNVPGAPTLGTTVTTETLASGQTVQVTAEPGVTQEQIERAVTQGRADAGRSYRQSTIQQEVAQTRAGVFQQEIAQQLQAKGYLTKGEIEALGDKYNLTAEEKKGLQKEIGWASIVPGQYTPVSPLTSTFFQQTQLRPISPVTPEQRTQVMQEELKRDAPIFGTLAVGAQKFEAKVTELTYKPIKPTVVEGLKSAPGGFARGITGLVSDTTTGIAMFAGDPVGTTKATGVALAGFSKQLITQPKATIGGIGLSLKRQIQRDPFYVAGYGAGLYAEGLAGGFALTRASRFVGKVGVPAFSQLYRIKATKIPAEEIFASKALKAIEKNPTYAPPFPKASPADTLKMVKERARRTGEGEMVVHTTESFPKDKEVPVGVGGPESQAGLQDPGIYTAPYGFGSPRFLRLGGGLDYPKIGVTINPLTAYRSIKQQVSKAFEPPVTVVVKDVTAKRLPREIIKERGYSGPKYTAFRESRKETGEVYVTKRSTVGSTSEAELAVFPGETLIREPTRKFTQIEGYTGIVIPVREYRLKTARPLGQIGDLAEDISGFGKRRRSKRVSSYRRGEVDASPIYPVSRRSRASSRASSGFSSLFSASSRASSRSSGSSSGYSGASSAFSGLSSGFSGASSGFSGSGSSGFSGFTSGFSGVTSGGSSTFSGFTGTPPPTSKLFFSDSDDKPVKFKSLKLPKFRQPKAYIPTLRATVGGIKAPRKGAKTRRLTGLEERPLLF